MISNRQNCACKKGFVQTTTIEVGPLTQCTTVILLKPPGQLAGLKNLLTELPVEKRPGVHFPKT